MLLSPRCSYGTGTFSLFLTEEILRKYRIISVAVMYSQGFIIDYSSACCFGFVIEYMIMCAVIPESSAEPVYAMHAYLIMCFNIRPGSDQLLRQTGGILYLMMLLECQGLPHTITT